MAKPNYRQAKNQKEAARKARKQEKLQRKQARVSELPAGADAPATPDPAGGAETA